MKWDDELESLATQVRDLFGDEAVAGAYASALTVTLASSTATDAVTPTFDAPRPMRHHTTFVDGRATAAALKAELRRLLLPN